MTAGRSRGETSLYRRNARHVTDRPVLHELEKKDALAELPLLRRRSAREQLIASWDADERAAAREGEVVVLQLAEAAAAFENALQALAAVDARGLRGKVEPELQRVNGIKGDIAAAGAALEELDFGAAGAAVDRAARELWLVGGPLPVVLNETLARAAKARTQRDALLDNISRRRAAKAELERSRPAGAAARVHAAVAVHLIEAAGFELAAGILSAQAEAPHRPRTRSEVRARVVPPQELETFADVAGLEEVKQQLRATVGPILEKPEEGARYRHNGILFYGPPGTGKTLLSRALAGEYGLRYIRLGPAGIGSASAHETAANLQRLFELAAESAPCLLFLDEVDAIAVARDDQPSGEHREVVTHLMTSLEEFRTVPGLVICAATNDLDKLDPGLREGRFDARIRVPLPDPEARREVLDLHLRRRAEAVRWEETDLDETVRLTAGRSAAALEQIVNLAAQAALTEHRDITQRDLTSAASVGRGRHTATLEERVTWDDIVLPEETREQLMDLVNVFLRPEIARSLGIEAPPGILLHGPPGTGKTTIAKAMAGEMEASFYEQCAADLLAKWAGESEERVARLFAKARANRPSIVFIDEIDGLLRTRGGDGVNRWEERVVSQFLRELDGLASGEGVLLVGATNRLDVVDPALKQRRLTPIEVGLPDGGARLRLLRLLFSETTLAPGVDLTELAAATEGMSGADLKRLRDVARMRTLGRAPRRGDEGDLRIEPGDLQAALDGMRRRASFAVV